MDLKSEISRRRTFAIISHPDAGKTTMTEKLLLYGGAIQMAGSVRARRSRKHAVSDWMAIERERGISVTAAVLQFDFNGCRLNLLDTPGHEDFSEDTYRALMAADAAVMLLDGGKGVEPQTEKLYAVCKLRRIPVFTFINKMDMPSLPPLQLLDEIEEKLGLPCTPMNWPIGNGPDFCGVYERAAGKALMFERREGGAVAAAIRETSLDDPEISRRIGPEGLKNLKEDLALVGHLGLEYDKALVDEGELSPVFFGSAMTNFGVETFLGHFLSLAPSPSARVSDSGPVDPASDAFTAFVFKTQANMDPRHRDRVAFLRVCSGRFADGMEVVNSRTQKPVRLSGAREFFGRERESADDAVAGDILGIVHQGSLTIGDSLCQGKSLKFPGIPRFSPEHFAILRSDTPAERKSFNKGMEQLLEEGAIQALRDSKMPGNDLILAAVGPLQFEVMQYRLKQEYNAGTTLERLPYRTARWVTGPQDKLDALAGATTVRCLRDLKGRLVTVFRDAWSLENAVVKNKDLEFKAIAPED